MNRVMRLTLLASACLVAASAAIAAPEAQPAAIAAPEAQPAAVDASRPGLAVPPEGWAYLPELAQFGPADIFRIVSADRGPKKQMQVQTAKNVGILTRDVDLPLTAGTTLKWRWKVDQLPSKLPETSIGQHDYLSIAVKFENGRDITYMWSSSLAEGVGFACPLPDWKAREYHVVVRSGPRELGKWLAESRNVAADYTKYIGGAAPGRIVQVWLIANTIIQGGEGKASFGNIIVSSGSTGRPLTVF